MSNWLTLLFHLLATLETSKHKTSSKPKEEVIVGVAAKTKTVAATTTAKKESTKPVLQEKSGPSSKSVACTASKPAVMISKPAIGANKVDVKSKLV